MEQADRRAKGSPVTLITVFEVHAEHADELVDGWRERAAPMSTKPGFLDTRLHRALSSQAKFQLVIVARWKSLAAFRAATGDPEFQERTQAASTDPRMPVTANPDLYRIVAGFG